MDPDLVRQQEEAQRVASGAAPKPAEESPAPAVAQVESVATFAPEVTFAEPVAEAPAAPAFEPGRKPPLPPHWQAESNEQAAEIQTPAVEAEVVAVETPVAPAAPVEKTAAPKKAGNPNRNALPPMGRRKKVDGEPVKKGFFRGWVKFVVLTLVGALLGAGAGFGAVQYLHLAPEQLNTTLAYGGGAGAVLLGLWALLHFDV
ncbi:hypothetical protein Rvan_3207 [Rhodomicrobium vannielii ATCC 17100]|uniref:Uncharacterized protein n=1 Tax=Rhodomicrobium vannielii (strain ATCC 17100 / DSM 162 / LMG 4299 / NCIMB 10020 / ATH 3.1.1) TaxID=648757 RepID=E3I1M7_RHOVT|nr:hypothetical protein [Rhodomicrobium vannielii]ADP72402.1 hypothetical protein Rvan_3207 [Rhodomicrobium vannielii ATCC 17100]